MKIRTLTNEVYSGTPYEILRSMRKASRSGTKSVRQFAREFAHRCKVIRPTARIRTGDYTYLLVDASSYGFLELLPQHEKTFGPDFGPKAVPAPDVHAIPIATEGGV